MMQRSKLDNYASERGARAYKQDYAAKLHRQVSDRLERRIFARFFARIGRQRSILDLPCGAGRLYELLAQQADAVVEADWSPTMLALNRGDHVAAARGYLRCSALEIPLADRAVDMAVSVRLSHHLVTQADRERHLQELFRVAQRHVAFTYFSFWSLKNVLRRLRAPIDRKAPKNTLRTQDVVRVARDCGFARLDAVPLSRLGSGHVFALFQRGAS
jgi:ubiquinone/menaquinone biosynthesis C-methylase UbiE